MQYVEIAPAERFGVPGAERVLVHWYAETPDSESYAWVAEMLSTRCIRGVYQVEQDGGGRARLDLRSAHAMTYDYETFVIGQTQRLLFRSRFTLEPAARTAEIERRLHFERD